jgi:hypothetical protein
MSMSWGWKVWGDLSPPPQTEIKFWPLSALIRDCSHQRSNFSPRSCWRHSIVWARLSLVVTDNPFSSRLCTVHVVSNDPIFFPLGFALFFLSLYPRVQFSPRSCFAFACAVHILFHVKVASSIFLLALWFTFSSSRCHFNCLLQSLLLPLYFGGAITQKNGCDVSKRI